MHIESGASGLGFMISDVWFRVEGLGSRVGGLDLRFWVQGFEVSGSQL